MDTIHRTIVSSIDVNVKSHGKDFVICQVSFSVFVIQYNVLYPVSALRDPFPAFSYAFALRPTALLLRQYSTYSCKVHTGHWTLRALSVNTLSDEVEECTSTAVKDLFTVVSHK